LDELYTKIIKIQEGLDSYKAIFISSGILPTKLLIEHPCNCYMCSGCNCHSEKNNICRKLIINKQGDILPESHIIGESFKIGNLLEDNIYNILERYKNSEAHNNFMKIVREAFLKYIEVCPYRVIPWTELFISISHNIELLKE
jgi:hypothetical protein